MNRPEELKPPGIWMPVKGRVRVLLPFNAKNTSANPEWLREVLTTGDVTRVTIQKEPGGLWTVARNHGDNVLAACTERFGDGKTVVIHDVAQQGKCGTQCQTGKPWLALYCQCVCGGENHGGVSGRWVMRGSYAISTEYARRIFTV